MKMKKPLIIILIVILVPLNLCYSQDEIDEKRTLIISGGGARVCWGAGFAKGLIESGHNYETVGGTSAGALIMSSVILNQFEELETLFNSITNESVYNVNPVRSNGGIRVFRSIFRTLFGKPSIGESKNLRKLIGEIFSKKDYESILNQNKTIFCVTTSLNTSKKSMKSIHSSTYIDMLDWIWASASVPVLMAPVKKDGQSWVDGGVIDNVPIDGAVIKGAKAIDVISLFPEEPNGWESSDALTDIAGRTLEILLNSSSKSDITEGILLSEIKEGTELNIYYMSEEDANFLSNLFSFESETLSEGYKKGYEAYKNTTMSKKTYIMGKNAKFLEN